MNPLQSYTSSTLRALCSSLIPETPDLAADRGDEHRPGAAEINLEENLRVLFNNLSQFDAGPLNSCFSGKPTLPLSTMIAVLLDMTSVEYLLRRSLEQKLTVRPGQGVFCWLAPEDRRDVLDFLDGESTIYRLNTILTHYSSYGGFLKYLIRGITTVPLITYYGEWDGYDQDGGKRIPDPQSFTGSVQSWDQTGFPGLKDGYDVFRGYEVEEFEENDY